MKYELDTGWPIVAMLAVIVSWTVFQVVLGSSLGSAVASPINIFGALSAFIMTIGWLQKRRRLDAR